MEAGSVIYFLLVTGKLFKGACVIDYPILWPLYSWELISIYYSGPGHFYFNNERRTFEAVYYFTFYQINVYCIFVFNE